ncbi:MAG TPA: glycosyltransferase [Methylomirabilota bacterium]|nr:glycosyltransferase [Methylomirabilota bacterium]
MLAHPRYYLRRLRYARPVLYILRLAESAVQLPTLPISVAPFLWHYYWLKWVGAKRIRVPAAADRGRHIVMLVQSNLHVDPRVQREAKALATAGFRVTVICPAWSPDQTACERIDWGDGVRFRILPARAGRFVLRFPHLFGRAILRAALAEDAWAYHAHDLDMALMALLAAARKQAACVCDWHEWYSENVSYDPWTGQYRPHHFFKRRIYQMMERCAVHSATAVVTVCQSIADGLATRYQSPKPIGIVRNIPEMEQVVASASPQNLRKRLGIAPGQRIFMYQGGLGPSRNLEPVIQAMRYVRGAALVIRGPGYEDYGEIYLELAKSLKVADRVFCLPPVPSTRVVVEARAADAGIWTLLANVGLNFKLALPNKVFEYIAAGVPLLVANLPEVRRLVDEFEIGLCFEPDDPRSIAACMNRFIADPGLLERCRANMHRAQQELSGGKEWQKLVELYRTLGER